MFPTLLQWTSIWGRLISLNTHSISLCSDFYILNSNHFLLPPRTSEEKFKTMIVHKQVFSRRTFQLSRKQFIYFAKKKRKIMSLSILFFISLFSVSVVKFHYIWLKQCIFGGQVWLPKLSSTIFMVQGLSF